MWLSKDSEEIDYLSEAKKFHKKFIRPFKGNPRGCWDFEILALEKSFGFELPAAYKQYLAWMGKDYRGIFAGSDCFISDVKNNMAVVSQLLDENDIVFELPKDYLCFFSHQGYIALWFDLPKISDDPPCWLFKESLDNKNPEIAGKFSEIILEDMKGLAEMLS